jgi:hypothetical protein
MGCSNLTNVLTGGDHMASDPSETRRRLDWEEREVADAADEAARIGGRAGDEYLDPVERPLAEAGEGVAEGFELAEEDLIWAAETAGGPADRGWSAFASERERSDLAVEYSEADHEASSELLDGDR